MPLATTGGVHTLYCFWRNVDAFGGASRPSSFQPSFVASTSAVPVFSASRYSRPSANVTAPAGNFFCSAHTISPVSKSWHAHPVPWPLPYAWSPTSTTFPW